ncbi:MULTISPECIES: hypothetical protein [unclassified Streptomyces]|uniref:hypothetical protein n=1 Tax=unclassified Streptomyces TaxID=2593676 RepID=UPI0025553FB9|nr:MULTISPECIES: hypothetical protein [unclassified Streptomyces]WRZ69100.1 hypothetical protein OG408_36720 [Streptomyces sp. NBC_01257]WSU63048.1 hypothetical protein OG450_36650 [Streptomyces sp. NBC_01104]
MTEADISDSAKRRGRGCGRDLASGKVPVLRGSPSGTPPACAQALAMYFLFLKLWHKVEIRRMTVEAPGGVRRLPCA